MWTSTTKYQFVMNISNPYPMTNWPTNKPNIWKRFIKRSVEESIYRNCKTWAIVDTPTTLHHHKNHRLHWIVTMISASICQHPSRQLICRELLQKLFIAFRDNLLGKLASVAVKLMMFTGLSCRFRELSFKKGDIIYIRRQIDRNWYEGEHNAMIGLLPVQYVDVSCESKINCTHIANFPTKRLFQTMALDPCPLSFESKQKVKPGPSSTLSHNPTSSCR